VAITRGGLVPAAIIARELNLRLIDTVCCSTYDRMERGAKVETLKGTTAEQEKGKGWLIVDDLVDTGVTARAVRAMLPGGAFRHGLCETRRPPDRRQLHHRGQPGHLDPVPLGPGGRDGQDDREMKAGQ
jgi:hypothetical protein